MSENARPIVIENLKLAPWQINIDHFLGLTISALTAKYRDLTFLVSFGVQLLMYGLVVIIPLAAKPVKYRWFIQTNPITYIIETFRLSFLGKGVFSVSALGYTSFCTLFILFAGIIILIK